MANELEEQAVDPETSPERLRELAAQHPSVRPLIAMNPQTYPGLLNWLASLNDPAVNVALQQRKAMDDAQRVENAGPQRVSVLQRGKGQPDSSPITPLPSIIPSGGGSNQPGLEGLPFASFAGEATSGMTAATAGGDEGADSRRRLIIILVAAVAVLFILLAGLALSKTLNRDGSDMVVSETGSAATQSTQSAEEDETAQTQTDSEDGEEPESEEVEELVVAYPAPDGALELRYVVSPSGNIKCELDADTVRCTINSYSFTDPSLTTCNSAPVTLEAGPDGTSVSCSVPPVSSEGATTLAYEDFAVNGYGACQSTERGVACWNTVTGEGFAVAREGFTTGKSGLIPTANFPWVR